MSNVNIFIDMDGVLARYDTEVANLMYDEGFFFNLPPMKSNIEMVKSLIEQDLNVYILSSVYPNSPYAIKEKNEWLDKYLPEIKEENRLFVIHPMTKNEFIRNKVPNLKTSLNVLIDDYTFNLINWEKEGHLGVKMINHLNNTNGTWIKDNPSLAINYRTGVDKKIKKLTDIINGYQD